MYSTGISKVNKWGSLQARLVLITSRYFYNLKKGNFFSGGNKLVIRAKFPLKNLENVVYSKPSKQIVFIFEERYDLHYVFPERDILLQFLFLGISLDQSPDKKISFYFLDYTDLSCYCNHPSRKRSRPLPPALESLEINREEFYVHFLGLDQDQVTTQQLEKKRISLQDFDFLQMLGIGDVSKVYLVKEKESNQLLALKALTFKDQTDQVSKDKFMKLILNERHILVKIDHPFVVKLKYAFQQGRSFFFAMSFV